MWVLSSTRLEGAAGGMACSSVALYPTRRGCCGRTGAALAPCSSLSPVLSPGAGGRLSCLDAVPTLTHLPTPDSVPLSRMWVARGSPPLLRAWWGTQLGAQVHPSLWGRALAVAPGFALTPPFPHLPPSLASASSILCPPPLPQLYLQARAPPEGDSDLATRLLTEPDVQKVPPWG